MPARSDAVGDALYVVRDTVAEEKLEGLVLMFGGHVMAGGVVSVLMTWKPHVA
jgi:hypothetical protein